MNRSSSLILLMAFAPSFSLADGAARLSLSELRERGATQLSREELQTLLPGSKLIHVSAAGYTRRWENAIDGRFVATGEGTRIFASARFVSGRGQWHIGDGGTYCVSIDWPGQVEQWCRYVFKSGDKYYGIASLDKEEAKATEFVLTK